MLCHRTCKIPPRNIGRSYLQAKKHTGTCVWRTCCAANYTNKQQRTLFAGDARFFYLFCCCILLLYFVVVELRVLCVAHFASLREAGIEGKHANGNANMARRNPGEKDALVSSSKDSEVRTYRQYCTTVLLYSYVVGVLLLCDAFCLVCTTDTTAVQ